MINNHNLPNAADLLRGPPASKVELLIERAGTSKSLTLTRAQIHVNSVIAQRIADDFVWIKIRAFQSDTANSLQQVVSTLALEKSPPAGLVLDLRGNPGGLIASAVNVADLFLQTGMIVSTKGRTSDAQLQFSATAGDLSQGMLLAVLIDRNSASAAEIVAGALQDQRRAVIVGMRSFGKGSVQSVLPLANGDALKLTTALYYTPSGRSIQAQGITPDIVVDAGEWVALAEKSARMSEADLPGHLAPNGETLATGASGITPNDRVLQEAVNALKAMRIALHRDNN
jgi:carboxyl-terminal processing protease